METSTEEGQSPSASSVRNTGSNVSAVPRPTVACQASNQAITCIFSAPQAAVAAAAITPRALAEPPAAPVGAAAAAAAAAPAPAPAKAPLAASVAAAVAPTTPAGALTAAPLVPSAAATALAKAHEETRVQATRAYITRTSFLYRTVYSTTGQNTIGRGVWIPGT